MSDVTMTGVLATVAGVLTWKRVSSSIALVAGKGYLSVGGGTLSFSLPANSIAGDTVAVSATGATGWVITQGASQYIQIGSAFTTTGTGGSLASSAAGDGVVLVCVIPDTAWIVVPGGSIGNITVV